MHCILSLYLTYSLTLFEIVSFFLKLYQLIYNNTSIKLSINWIFYQYSNKPLDSSFNPFRYRAPFTSKAWVDKFKHVIGIIHTNYLIYTRGYTGGAFKEPLLFYINQGMCRANCHKIIKLSGKFYEYE